MRSLQGQNPGGAIISFEVSTGEQNRAEERRGRCSMQREKIGGERGMERGRGGSCSVLVSRAEERRVRCTIQYIGEGDGEVEKRKMEYTEREREGRGRWGEERRGEGDVVCRGRK